MDPSNQIITWHEETLPKPTKLALEYLSRNGNWLKPMGWYLAGGTALALYEGHRTSVDLDFFTTKKTFSNTMLLEHFTNDIWKTDILKEKTVYGQLYNAKISFIAYPFFKPNSKRNFHGSVPVLIPHDIGIMKVIAISQRGRKRDFVDLYWYSQKYEPLDKLILSLKIQYPTVAHDYHHIIKSLTYFADAEDEPMPKLYFPATWKEVKKFFTTEVPKLTKKLLNLD